MVARVSLGGRRVRVRLSSAFNTNTVKIGAAHIALRSKDSAVAAGSDRVLTFGGKPSVTLYSGGVLISDPVSLDLPPLSDVAVSLYFPGDTGFPTVHYFGLHDTYISKEGDFSAQPAIPDPTITQSYYWLAGIDVVAPADACPSPAYTKPWRTRPGPPIASRCRASPVGRGRSRSWMPAACN